MIINRFLHYIGDRQDNSDYFIQCPTYACNAQICKSMHKTQFSVSVAREPPGSWGIVQETFGKKTQNYDFTRKPKEGILARIKLLKTKTYQMLEKVQEACKANFYKRINKQPIFEATDLVYLGKPSNTQ